MRIAIAQMNTRAGDFSATCERMVAQATSAKERGADVVVFPYAALTGPTPVNVADEQPFLFDAAQAVAQLSERLPLPAIVPVVGEVEGESHAEAMLIEDGELTPLRTTAWIASMSALEDSARSTSTSAARLASDLPAPDLPEFNLGGLTCGVAFTDDDLDDYDDYDFDVDVIFYLPAYGFAADDPSSSLAAGLDHARFVEDARQTGAWIVAVGSLGLYGSQVYTGSSFVLSPDGTQVACAPALEEALLVADVEARDDRPATEGVPYEVYDPAMSLWGALTLALGDLARKGGSPDVAIDLDGSAPSLALAVLATDALGPTHVHALVATDDRVAQELARNLRIDVRRPDFRMPVPAPDAWAQGSPALERDVRAAFVAELARQTGAMVLSAQDKTGAALDAGGPGARAGVFAPFGDVYRSDVLAMAHARNTVSPVIPVEGLDRFELPDVYGLAGAAATDAGRLRAVDAILRDRIEGEASLTDLVAAHQDADLVESVVRRVADAELARRALPACPVVSTHPLALSPSPLGLAWVDHVRGEDERVDEDEVLDALEDFLSQDGGQQEGQTSQDADRDLADAFELIRELSQSSWHRRGQAGDGRREDAGPQSSFWSNPFSEN